MKTVRYLSIHLNRDHPASKVGEVPSVSELSIIATNQKFHFFGPNKTQKKKYIYCGDCDFNTYRRSTLVTHVKKFHPESASALPPPLQQQHQSGSYTSSYCSLFFQTLKGLKHHEMLHPRKSNYQCEFCSYSVSSQRHLKKHLNEVHPQWSEDSSS